MDLSRRRLLRLSAFGAAGVAGCASRRSIPDPGVPRHSGATATPTTSHPLSSGPKDHPLPRPEDLCTRDPGVEVADPLAVPFDARERFKCQGKPLDNFESLEPWTVHTGSLAADSEHVYSGTQSARVEATAGDERARIHRRFPGGIDLSGYDLSMAVRLDSPAVQGVTVHLAAPDNENALLLGRQLREAGWLRLDLGPYRSTGSPDLSAVTRITVQAYTGGGTNVRYFVDSLRLHPRGESGRVVLTFNESRQSHYEQAFEVTEQHGVQGVVSVRPGSTTWKNRIPMSGLREMQAAGWDVVSSPRSGGGFRRLAPPEQTARILEGKRWLVDNGFERGANVLVWPSGEYDRHGLQVASRYHRLGFAGGSGPVGSVTAPLVVGRVGGGDRERVERLLDFAARYDQTLPLSFNAVGNGRTGIARETFAEILTSALDRGLDVVTASDLLADLTERTEPTSTPTPTPGA